ncbi:MAG: aminomethyl-transferring glycine dehydrogenase subunit GcvPA [Planctomycetaceae bacterium]|nr:aminomethyl-transferring glycine dehydrogenase subunit GcvPA [Planctomycetota bacterium]NUN51362.1 aminomethyl-transferring glycine dehydrogenase subunit GcvPA [Planctomycetaceae bacterium]
MPYIPHSAEDVRAMLAAIGVRTVDDLFEDIPKSLRARRKPRLPRPITELELQREAAAAAAKTETFDRMNAFVGAGVYDHFIPAVVQHLAHRVETVTSYTPYQPEASQGNLTFMFEYQTAICELTGMDVSNASMYEGGSACAEACLMAVRVNGKGRRKILVSRGLHPEYLRITETYLRNIKDVVVEEVPLKDGVTDLGALARMADADTIGVLVQTPNFLGIIEDGPAVAAAAKAKGAKLLVCADPISLALLEPPGAWGADIVCGEGQQLASGLAYGGPYFGFFAAKQEYIRQMPGRISGETVDVEGRRGFVLTLGTREQHIRRDRATSNICTNQGLLALRGLVYLAALGPTGLREVAEGCLANAHYAAERIAALPGWSLSFPGKPFFHEFAVDGPLPAERVIASLRRKRILPGVALSRWWKDAPNRLLVAATEVKTRKQIDALAKALASAK